jgi:hypothetical protein
MKIKIIFKEILNKGCWEEFCEEMGYSVYN